MGSAAFDLSGALRRVRRIADLSQRELARAGGVSVSAVAHAEAGTRDLPVTTLARLVELAGLRLVLVDSNGREVQGMSDAAVRDFGRRRFPAHLDTRYGDQGWWHGPERYSRPQPWFTFDRHRDGRDALRRLAGTPDDHHLPQPGDSPQERRAARQRALRERAAQEWRRRLAAGEVAPLEQFTCTCPPACDDWDDLTRPRHAPGCGCGCDLD